MPASNPFAPLIDVGGTVGPVSASSSVGVGGVTVGDHHVTAGFVAVALITLVLLWRNKFRFSTTVG